MKNWTSGLSSLNLDHGESFQIWCYTKLKISSQFFGLKYIQRKFMASRKAKHDR